MIQIALWVGKVGGGESDQDEWCIDIVYNFVPSAS